VFLEFVLRLFISSVRSSLFVLLFVLRMNPELVTAAQTGDLKILKSAYEKDHSVIFTTDNQNCSLLHWAAIVIFRNC
jgi:hypothetical protein